MKMPPLPSLPDTMHKPADVRKLLRERDRQIVETCIAVCADSRRVGHNFCVAALRSLLKESGGLTDEEKADCGLLSELDALKPCPLCDSPPSHGHASSCPRSPLDPMGVRRPRGVRVADGESKSQ